MWGRIGDAGDARGTLLYKRPVKSARNQVALPPLAHHAQIRSTPMHVAVYKGHVDVIMAIIETKQLQVAGVHHQVGGRSVG